MIEVDKNLFVSDENSCFYEDRSDWVVVHACKHPCHLNGVGYQGNLHSGHPNYLVLEKENHLFLNMVDMARQLSHTFTKPIINAALNFIERNIKEKKVLIHCNKGESRSPALALLFLAKKKSVLSNDSYCKAKEEFTKLYPGYNPGRGVEIYLNKYWRELE